MLTIVSPCGDMTSSDEKDPSARIRSIAAHSEPVYAPSASMSSIHMRGNASYASEAVPPALLLQQHTHCLSRVYGSKTVTQK